MSRSECSFVLLVFDWDGTLMDSVSSIVACTQETLAELDLPPASEETIRKSIGLSLREMVERFVPGCDDALFARVVAVYRRLWFGGYCLQPRLFPGVPKMLAELRRRGFLLAVATGKSRKGLDRDLRSTDLDGAFDATRTADETRSKPHPQMILDILEELEVRAAEALVIGDARHDLEMAHNAGASAAAVCTGSHSREGLKEASPLVCLENVGELAEWLETGESGRT